MNKKEIKAKLLEAFDVVTFHRDGSFTAKKSYFYRHGLTSSGLAEVFATALPESEVLDHGDHLHAFVGDAESGSSQDSYLWVKGR